MDDLAGAVLEQLRIKDGNGPFALLYENELRYRVLVSTAKRVDGVLLYQHAYVDLRSSESRAASAKGERIEWDFVAFTDVNAAAYFALAFMQLFYKIFSSSSGGFECQFFFCILVGFFLRCNIRQSYAVFFGK